MAVALCALELSPAERTYLRAHSVITFHNEHDWKPYDYTENGVARGFCIDVVMLIAQKAGFKAEFISGKTWDEYMQMLRDGEIDVLHNTAKTPERETWMHFSSGYIVYKDALFVHKQAKEVKPLRAFEGLTLAVVKNYYQEELLRTHYPSIKLYPVENSTESLKAVETRKADAAINEVGVGNNLISDHRLRDVVFGRIVEDPRFSLPLHLAVRRDQEVLGSILQKGLDAITDDEMMDLQRKWLIMGPQEGFKLATLLYVVLAGGLIHLLLAYRTQLLKTHNTALQKTQKALESEVAQKELLLRELNHRVKNNLQIISLQSGKKERSAVLEETENSIAAIALAYDRLVYTDRVDEVDLAHYLKSLLERSLHFGPQHLRRVLEAPDRAVHIQHAVTLGLIITECYHNSLKYAFDEQTDEALFGVRVSEEAEHLCIVVYDNGRGYPEQGPKPGIGMELIIALCRNRLHVTPEFYNDGGACMRIRIPLSVVSA